ncbi:MAG: nitrite/sulfite reductase [Candidatus Omnitrophica bacterium]|nr:nitrite/sulfite reductase [Candidatus Omnitrophota bacterium]
METNSALTSRALKPSGIPLPVEVEKDLSDFSEMVSRYLRREIFDDTFRPFRLMRGVYGQRQGGTNHMIRIKIPSGILTRDQLVRIADIIDNYTAHKLGHITTRQDIQIHFVQTPDTPTVLRLLYEAGLTTREACGNSIRNVVADPMAGVSSEEPFDVTPYARMTSAYFLRHPDSQKLPRKFKINFASSHKNEGQVTFNEIGLVPKIKAVNGKPVCGFKMYAGGGLGAAPMVGQLLSDFVQEKDFLRLMHAIVRIQDRCGDRVNKNQARMKFLVRKIGFEEFKKRVLQEAEALKAQGVRYPDIEEYKAKWEEAPPPSPKNPPPKVMLTSPEFNHWKAANVFPQKHKGYSTVEVLIPIGDMTPAQMRGMAELSTRFADGKVRLSITQNVLIRWVRDEHVLALYVELQKLGFPKAGAGQVYDVLACPGADTCNLGITSSKGLARALNEMFAQGNGKYEDVKDLTIKISGCPNSCGQHHVAALGFHGAVGTRNGREVPHVQMFFGGGMDQEVCQIGRAIMKLPTKKVPEAVERIIALYRKERAPGESIAAYLRRLDREAAREALKDLAQVEEYDTNRGVYVDWDQKEEFKLTVGQGECAV